MNTDELWQQFFYHLKVKRRSKATMKYYECTQRVFGRYLAEQRLGAILVPLCSPPPRILALS